jgi:hypothetical protein
MKPVIAPCFLLVAVILAVCAGCANSNPSLPAPTPTPTPVMTTVATPAPEPTPWPGALALNQEAPFGIAGKNGTATVYKAELRSNYSWSSPSFNSPRGQALAGEPLGTQHGYSTTEPAAGNRFLFVYVRLTDTGTDRMVAPSPNQFVVDYQGKTYTYQSVAGSDVSIISVRVTQYDYLIGKGGVAGYLDPGAGNAADGYLIYEVPATIDLAKAYLAVTLDTGHQAAWKLG